ncbi:hypothetical protein [Paenibacillus tianjinensis]|uniref:Adhesin n=1 Tax=Paenibacillus tianjinensis TaxID=2810347 RepID=A0ABX7LAC1_9BACL|nr:hypothetical protein [Paenibacillus tianjinensis]QSF42962.1 hypothetical protein JRJ22_16845 [Paenibacillus tianjinensis]
MRKKHSTAIIAAVTVFSLVLLAGCRELPGKEAADNQLEESFSGNNGTPFLESLHLELSEASEEVGQDIEEAAGNVQEAAGNVQEAVQEAAAEVTDQINENGLRQDLTVSLKSGDSTGLILDNAVGKIDVVSVEGDTVHVSASVIAHNPVTKEVDQKILDNAEVSIESNRGKLMVSAHPKDSPKKDLWTWAQKKYKHSDFSINYVIEVPAGITGYEINNNVGSVQLSGLQGSFKIISDVGTISLQDVQITGKSIVQTDTGSISLGLGSMTSGSSLTASSDVGAIKTTLASGLKCTVKASSELGAISGVSKGKQDYNGGGPLLALSTEIGAITVRD